MPVSARNNHQKSGSCVGNSSNSVNMR